MRPIERVTNLSPDKLGARNVSMVEPTYWERAARFSPGRAHTTSASVDDLRADEIVLRTSRPKKGAARRSAAPFLCNSLLHKGKAKQLAAWRNATCLKWCDIRHFGGTDAKT